MDPRLAKRQRLGENSNNGNNNSNGWANNSTPTSTPIRTPTATPNGKPPNVTPTKPYHEMTEEEAISIVSAVRKEMPKITTTVEVATNGHKNYGLKNGVDSQIWSDIFDVRSETDMPPLTADTTGLMVAKASLREPMKIGEYSLKISSRGSDRFFCNDASELKYLHMPPLIADISLDLTHGYEMVSDIHWGKPSETKIDELLKWISLNRKKFMVAGEMVPQSLHTDFSCYRGTLTKIMATPYEHNDRWVIGATKFKGTIYLCQFHEEFPPPDDYYNMMSFGGFRFEQYLVGYDPNIPPDPNDFDPDHHEYCVVMRSRLISDPQSPGHSLVYGAELDAALPHTVEQPGKLKNFVELKTTKMITSENQYRSFCKYKLLKWWLQSYMVGVPQIVCGYKDQKHMVKKVETMQIESFPHLAQEFWSANVCLNFLNKTLNYMKQVISIDDPNVVYLFSYSPGDDIRCKRLIEPKHFQILPDWYIREFYH